MMEMELMSECAMCDPSVVEVQMACCSEDVEEDKHMITVVKDQCCELSVVDRKLSDKFFFSKLNLKEEFSLVSILVEDNYNNQNNFSFYTSNRSITESPPGLLTNQIYLNLSVFLI